MAFEAEKALRIIERLEDELTALRSAQSAPIAIVGVSCRFPGAGSPDVFWSLLQKGEESTSEVPRERWDIDSFYDGDPDALGKMSTRYGGFLENVDQFDAPFFNISPREAMLMDPQQRLLLELSWEALENAGLSADALYGSPSGVFVGICASDYVRMAAQNEDNLTAYFGTGNATSVAAGRLAYTFGFSGPCMSIDTACSSALVAVHYACESLRKGECGVALAASVNLILAPETTVAFSKARMMAADGRCKTFDERADGYVRSEGAAVVVLKTLSKAQLDGDPILAVIRGSAINQDGASSGLTVPNGPSQVALIRQALARAEVKPEQIDYIEAHGTGTALGDPIEVGALAEVFGRSHDARRPLLLGSVKTLLGHLEMAAGMPGLLKIVLALQNESIPGYRHLQQLSRRIPWEKLPFVVPRESRHWPKEGKLRLAGISAFGFSGTNAHLVVQEAPRNETAETATANVEIAETAKETQPSHLLCLSAKTPAALAGLSQRYADWLQEHPDADLDEVCWTANTGRARFSHRLAIQAVDVAALRERLATFAETQAASGRDVLHAAASSMEKPLAFLFSGQGAQYAGMGKELYDRHPFFRGAIDRCERILGAWLDKPLRQVMWGEHTALLNQTEYTQPVLFSLEYAMATLWQSWGIQPSYVMGHSVGEFAAACIAGIFSLEDGLALIAARGRAMQRLPNDGAMAAVLAGREAIAPVLEKFHGRLSMAAFNTPDQTVISGERAAVLEACEVLQAEHGIRNRGLLDVSHAFHSPLMQPILAEFAAVAETVKYRRPTIAIVSNVTGKCVTDVMMTAQYWVDHVLAPVDFMAGIRELEESGTFALLEVGPSATLIGLAKACTKDERFLSMASLRSKVGDWSQVLGSLGTLFVHGFAIDWRKAGRCEQPPPAKAILPNYPFQRQRYWLQEADGSFKARQTTGKRHPLLGERLHSAALSPGDLLFEGMLRVQQPGYLQHHRVYEKVVVPAAAYVEMALGGIRREFPNALATLRNVAVQAALVLPPESETVVQSLYLDMGDGRDGRDGRYRFKIFSTRMRTDSSSRDNPDWQLHVSGEIELSLDDGPEGSPVRSMAAVAPSLPSLRHRFDQVGEHLDIEAFYGQYASLGLRYEGSFRSVVRLSRISDGPGEVLARIDPPGVSHESLADYVLHPALLDGCFQAVGAMAFGRTDVVFLPIGIERLCVVRPPPPCVWAHAILRRSPTPDDPRVIADISLIDDDGEIVGIVEGLQAVRVDRRALAHATATWKDKLYSMEWVPQPRSTPARSLDSTPARSLDSTPARSLDAPAASPDPRPEWLVLSDRGGVGARLKALLEARGETCIVLGEDELDGRDRASWSRVLERQLAGIVHLRALDENNDHLDPASLERSQARLCGSTLALLQALMDKPNQRLPRLWLVTRGAQAAFGGDPVNVAPAALWGFGRTIALEHPSLHCTLVDVDHDESIGDRLVDELLDLHQVPPAGASEAELQIAYRSGKRYVARLNRVSSLQSKHELTIPDESYHLRISEYGSLDRLTLIPTPRREPAPDEVEIEVRAAAINFKDVLYGLGMLKAFSERAGIQRPIDQPLGFECAGRIARVGSRVTTLAVGDDVFAMAPSAMASHVTIDRRLVHRKPQNLTFEQSASLPAAFMTAIHSLERLARIKTGDKVLIHACAGGVGQAALQIARARGATVYGTASPAKWSFLKQQGVEHVMHSRTLDFADEIMRITGGRGVDVVINSLTGDFISKSADALAKGGRFVEIGKIGIWSAAEMAAYRPDVAYFSFDLGDIEGEGELQAELLTAAVRGLEKGLLMPLPVKSFPIEQAEAGFRYLAQAKNIGKVVLTLPSHAEHLEPSHADPSHVDKPQRAGPVRPDRSYLITGGWGALGLRIAESLVANGARQIVLSGRSAPDDRASSVIESLRARGVRILVKPTDVADPAQVDAVMQQIAEDLSPLGGIVHAAGVLDDGTIVKQTWERFAEVLSPKVAGSWNLHRASAESNLDFFILFSSFGSWIGAPGQANYAAANAFMDALSLHRKSLGLPSTCINWGPWAASGMAEKTRAANRTRFESFGLRRMSMEDNTEVFEYLLDGRAGGAAVVDIDWTKFLKMVRDPRVAKFYSLVDKSAALAERQEIGALAKRLASEPEELRASILIDALRGQIASVTGLPSADQIDLQQPLLSVGFDSLMAVELKSRLESSLGCALGATLLFDYPTLEKLAHHLIADVLRLHLASSSHVEPISMDLEPAETAPVDEVAVAESFIDAGDGRKLCLCSWGREDAPLVLCVHGILDQAAIWDEVAAGLVKKGHRVVALDLRGHGRSDHQPGNVNITVMDFLLDLTTMTAKLGAKHPFVLVGHSMGAVVAGLYASAYPEKVSHLVLVEPVMPALREQHSALDLLKNDLRYIKEAPAHTVYPDLKAAARMLTLSHGGLTTSRSMKLAARMTEPCEGGVRWTWDVRLRNPMGIDLTFSPEHYLALLRALEVHSTRIYGTTSQFAGTPVLVPPTASWPRSRSVSVPGGHNLHTDDASMLLEILASIPSERHESPRESNV